MWMYSGRKANKQALYDSKIKSSRGDYKYMHTNVYIEHARKLIKFDGKRQF